jgi:hypothetical protein
LYSNYSMLMHYLNLIFVYLLKSTYQNRNALAYPFIIDWKLCLCAHRYLHSISKKQTFSFNKAYKFDLHLKMNLLNNIKLSQTLLNQIMNTNILNNLQKLYYSFSLLLHLIHSFVSKEMFLYVLAKKERKFIQLWKIWANFKLKTIIFIQINFL